MRKAQAEALMGLGLSDLAAEDQNKILSVNFGRPGEASRYLSDDTKLEIAMILMGHWLSRERFPADQEAYILALHKQVTRSKATTEVMILPDGSLVILVTHQAGYNWADFVSVNHCFIRWIDTLQQWQVEKVHFMSKMAALKAAQAAHPRDLDRQVEALFTTEPRAHKPRFGKLLNAVEEAQAWVKSGYIPLHERRGPSQAAIDAFNDLPALTSLRLSEDELFEAALHEVETGLPCIWDLHEMAARSAVRN